MPEARHPGQAIMSRFGHYRRRIISFVTWAAAQAVGTSYRWRGPDPEAPCRRRYRSSLPPEFMTRSAACHASLYRCGASAPDRRLSGPPGARFRV
jgi:hypothetical protein